MDSKASYDGNIQTTDPGMAELGIGLVPRSTRPNNRSSCFSSGAPRILAFLGSFTARSLWRLASHSGSRSLPPWRASPLCAGRRHQHRRQNRPHHDAHPLPGHFGKRGNIAPTSFCWVNLMGWEAVNIITGTLTLVALFAAMGLEESLTTTALSLFLFGGLTVLVSVLGQNAVLMMQNGSPGSLAP